MIASLDRLLGRVTSIRLVIGCLSVLAAWSILLGFLGHTAFRGIEQLASLAVTMAVTHLVNTVAARIARVSPQLASTTVTALLLFFILPPHLDLPRLGLTALAAAIAVIGKYLITVRGRHLLNPAATGAFAATVFGLGPAIWWVATPLLFPVVAVGAVLVLYRARLLPPGLVLIVVGTAVPFFRYLSQGTDPGAALLLATASSPLLFLAGFMFTEPLTLPPRRRQQFVVAVIVAVVASVPFSTGSLPVGPLEVGPVSSTPEFALLVGNLVAFFFGQRRALRLELVAKRRLTPTSWEFELRPLAPVRFTAGQFIELALPHRGPDAKGARRVFSIASASPDRIRLGVRSTEPLSSFKAHLLELEPGARLAATSVGGDFVLPRDPSSRLLLVAGGIGITPFVGHLEQLAGTGRSLDVDLVYAVSTVDELAYLDELERSGVRVAIASPDEPAPAQLRPGWRWVGPERLSADRILEAVPDAAERIAYLSGPPAMVGSLRQALRRAGVRRIRTDVFLRS